MIVEREEAIEAFKPEEYWNLHVVLETEKKKRSRRNITVFIKVPVISHRL